MTEILSSIPTGCIGYVGFFVLGLFFPQVRLADVAAAFFRSTEKPKP